MHTFKNVYSSYSTSVEEPISKKLFKEICERFNMEVIEGILEGSVLNTSRSYWLKVKLYSQKMTLKDQSGLYTTLIRGIASTIGKSINAKYPTKRHTGLPLPEA